MTIQIATKNNDNQCTTLSKNHDMSQKLTFFACCCILIILNLLIKIVYNFRHIIIRGYVSKLTVPVKSFVVKDHGKHIGLILLLKGAGVFSLNNEMSLSKLLRRNSKITESEELMNNNTSTQEV